MQINRRSLALMQPHVRRWSFLRKLRNPFAGLRGPRRNSGGDLILLSRHWPHLLCWSWTVLWMREGGRRVGGYRNPHGGGVAWFGPLRLSWQAYDWMVSSRPDVEADAIAYVSRRA